MRYGLPLALLLSTNVSLIGGENWPQFRGPNGNGIADARSLPIKWSETENIRWKVAIHGKAWSSPVIWGNQVWMTTANADGKEFFAVCVDRRTGKILHDVRIFTEENPAFCIAYNSYASCTPVIEEGRFYAHFGSHGTACLDTATGKVLWERRDLKCNHFRGPGSSAILHENLLILLFDGVDVQYVTALDKTTGKTVWKTDRNIQYPPSKDGDFNKAYSTASVLKIGGKAQLICPAAEATVAYDAATGAELWRVIHGGMNAAARPVFGHDLIYLTSGHTLNLLAVRQGKSGTLKEDDIVWKVKGNVPSRPSLLLVDDLLYMVSDKGIASCLDPKTGKQLWQDRLNGAFCSSPLFAAGHIYMSDEDGNTHVLAPGPIFKEVAVNKLDAGCMSSLAVAGDALFLRTKTHVYCIASK